MSHYYSLYKDQLVIDGHILRPRKWHETRTATVLFSGLFLAAVATMVLIVFIAFP